MPRILAGSTRAGGFNHRLVRIAAEPAVDRLSLAQELVETTRRLLG